LLLTAIALICCSAIPTEKTITPAIPSLVVVKLSAGTEPDAKDHSALPDSPAAKPEVLASGAESSSSENITPGAEPFIGTPTKAAVRESYETARQRRIWCGLMAASHSAAVFDAWSTRRAISGGYGSEADPTLRPFAHSTAMYAATQVSPAVMDFVGHRMMTSNHLMLRRFWWVPQVAGTSVSLTAAVHNYRLVP
jgi:hypothetical protein